MASIPDIWINTVQKNAKNSVKWSIFNFDCSKERTCKVFPSKTFALAGKFKYNITIKIVGSTCKERRVEVTLPKMLTVIEMKINLSILHQDGTIFERYHVFGGDGGSVKFNMFEEKNDCLLSGKHFTILCEVILEYYKSSTNIERFEKRESHNHLKDLYTHKKHWDVMFVVAGAEINAHKCILASRSEVFAAMFEHEMEESKSNKVVIDDIDFEIFDEMLRYIYTNKLLNLNKNADGLLAASEKYNLKDLKCLCETKLIETVTVKNAIETLMLADLYRAEVLKNYTMDFINLNRKSLSNTDEWQKFVNTHLHLILALYLK